MYFKFDDYCFDIKKQLLYKDEELIPLSKNQTELLTLFLLDADSVHNKNDILDEVWKNQIVTEQVVFQTISQLRAIFGTHSIKTYSRKGYKWNLTVNKITKEITPKPLVSTSNIEQMHVAQNKRTSMFYGLLVAITLLIFIGFQVNKNFTSASTNIYVVTTKESEQSEDSPKLIKQALSATGLFKATNLKTNQSKHQLFAAPHHVYNQISASSKDWLLWTKSYSETGGAIVHYGLVNNSLYWEGYIHSSEIADIPSAVANKLISLHSMGLLAADEDKISIDKFTHLLDKFPNDADVLLYLANYYQELEHYDVALGYLSRVLKIESSPLNNIYKSKAYWLKGKIYKNQGLYENAQKSLDSMATALENSPISELYFEHLRTSVWLAYNQFKNQIAINTIKAGLRYFERQNNPLMLFKTHILASIIAKKTSNEIEKYQHLSQAEALLIKHNLDESNQAIIYFHRALFANAEPSAVKTDNGTYATYLERILLLPKTSDNLWVHDEAFELLVTYYLKQNEFSQAISMFDTPDLPPKKNNLKARVLLAQGKREQAIAILEHTFDQARIEYNTRSAVMAAHTLYELYEGAPDLQAQYKTYLELNSTAKIN